MSLAKKLKMIVKGEPKPTFGTDPNDPWSARAGITESEAGFLSSYLKSRGINPQFVSRDTKISHAKSAEFSKWKRDHRFDDPADYVSSVARDKMKAQREEVQFDEAKTVQGTALDKFRQAAAERARKHDDIEREMKARHAAGKEDMKGSIDRLEKQLNKEDAGINKAKETKFHKKLDTLVHNTFGKRKDELKMKEETEQVVNEMDTYPHPDSKEGKALMKAFKSSAKKDPTDLNAPGKSPTVKQTTSALLPMLNKSFKKSMKKEEVVTEKNDSHTHAAHYEDPKTGEWTGMNLLIAKDDEDAIRQANEKCKEGCRLTKVERHITVKEDVERIDELKKSTVFSWLKQQPVVPVRKPGSDRVSYNQKIKNHSRSWNRALDRLSGYKPTSEDVFQDPQAATQTAFDMGTQADDREPTYSRKKEMSKSARMIKALYKKHKMVKEELYDHEKEDKSVSTYGKKPKVEKVQVDGDENNQAAMVLKGGKTLTGQTRDTLEIDPVMRKPSNSDNKNNNTKTDK
jgi:hypothetical protein